MTPQENGNNITAHTLHARADNEMFEASHMSERGGAAGAKTDTSNDRAPAPPPAAGAGGSGAGMSKDEARNATELDKLMERAYLFSQFMTENMASVEADVSAKMEENRKKKKKATHVASSSPASAVSSKVAAATTGRSMTTQSPLGKRKERSNSSHTNVNSPGASGGSNKSSATDLKSLEADDEAALEATRDLLPLVTGGAMRPYQLKGVRWLISLYQNGINGILADQMGLGKTVQCIGFLSHLQEKGVVGPHLVLGPVSTLPNWVSEFKRWAPTVPCILYRGDKDERALLREQHLDRRVRNSSAKTGADKKDRFPPVVVTNYETLVNDAGALQKYNWKYIVVDEGHRLKNSECKLVKRLRVLTERRSELDKPNKLLLTGTPLQNSLPELWSLLNFVMPNAFPSEKVFVSLFEDIQNGANKNISTVSAKSMAAYGDDATRVDAKDTGITHGGGGGSDGASTSDRESAIAERRSQVVSKLHSILQPFVLRRVKADVEQKLPGKKEIVLYAQMTRRQKVVSDAIHTYALNKEVEPLVDALRGELEYFEPKNLNLNNPVMHLRKVANHPDLFTGKHDGSILFPTPEENYELCGKMKLLERILAKLKRDGHKVLIFSQFTSMLDILEAHLSQKGFEPCRIDGQTPLEDRRRQMDEFNSDPDVFIFMLSTRAGGLGINLTGADTVIIYDSDWNPHQDLQAMDRCHRIGQTRPVHVYRLASANSVEGKMLEVAGSKLALDRVVMKQGTFTEGLQKGSAVDADEILKLMANDVSGGGIAQSKDISDEDLDRLMDRSDLEDDGAPPSTIEKTGPGWEVMDARDSSALLSGVGKD